MPDYQKLYHLLFNAITDAIDELDNGNTNVAKYLLKKAQCSAEDIYIASKDKITILDFSNQTPE